MHTAVDMYKAWCKEKLRDNPGYTHEYDYVKKIPGARIIRDEQGNVVMNYTLFRNILETYNRTAGDMIIEGKRLRLGKYLGIVQALRAEIKFGKLRVNWGATKRARKTEPTHPVIYMTQEECVVIRWIKPKRITNESVYHFAPAVNGNGLRERFNEANRTDPLLRTQYKFIPLQ